MTIVPMRAYIDSRHDHLCRCEGCNPQPPAEPTTQLYYVNEDQADDPSASRRDVLTAAEIGERYPNLAALFPGDGTESLTYTHELWRVHITALLDP